MSNIAPQVNVQMYAKKVIQEMLKISTGSDSNTNSCSVGLKQGLAVFKIKHFF